MGLLYVVIIDGTVNGIDENRMAFHFKPLPEQLQGALLRPNGRIRIPTFEFFFEQNLVVSLYPSIDRFLRVSICIAD